MNLETFGGLSAILAVLFFLACVILGIAALIMPIVVFYIYRRTEEIAKILSSMEDMMRNGK
tara:strand:+ start:196 stop:378 length:183 start_codon:yes stop_codon:yes gene_type:complete